MYIVQVYKNGCWDMNVEKIKQRLRTYGLKSTQTRIAVLQILLNSDRPLSHSDIVQTLDNIGDQATIYRSLVSFLQVGLTRIASNVSGIVRYEVLQIDEKAHEVHPHFVCEDCGIVECLPKTTMITTVDPLWQTRLQHSKVQFVGLCETCVS